MSLITLAIRTAVCVIHAPSLLPNYLCINRPDQHIICRSKNEIMRIIVIDNDKETMYCYSNMRFISGCFNYYFQLTTECLTLIGILCLQSARGS
jgi:hypothetical protein